MLPYVFLPKPMKKFSLWVNRIPNYTLVEIANILKGVEDKILIFAVKWLYKHIIYHP